MFKGLYDIPIGFSDHSTGITSAVIAVTIGAKVIEKHITLDKTYPGPDHPFALEPDEMKQMVEVVRETESALGQSIRLMSTEEINARKMIRRSIVTRAPINKGEAVTPGKIKFSRPGTGISTNEFQYVDGRRLNRNVSAEVVLKWEMLKK